MNTERTAIASHPVVRFGEGDRQLVILPGLSDALQGDEPSRFTRVLLERYYMRAFTDSFDVYVVSRRRELAEDVTTRELAADYAEVLSELGQADVLGISMGGLIAQYLAIDHPDTLRKLVVAFAGPRLSERGHEAVSEWACAAAAGNWRDVYLGTIEATYTSRSKRAVYGALFKLPGVLKPPPYPEDFVASARACLNHDATDELDAIEAESLVLGGEQDVLFDATALREMARAIPNAKVQLLENTGHGGFEERRGEFCDAVVSFLTSESV